jgi:hypothetical protein
VSAFTRGDRVRSTDARWPNMIGRVLDAYGNAWHQEIVEVEFETHGPAPAAGNIALLPASKLRRLPPGE